MGHLVISKILPISVSWTDFATCILTLSSESYFDRTLEKPGHFLLVAKYLLQKHLFFLFVQFTLEHNIIIERKIVLLWHE